MLEGKSSNCMLLSFSLISCSLVSMAWGKVGVLPPVIFLNAQPHLLWNWSKNSRRSGSSFGDGENLSPRFRASD